MTATPKANPAAKRRIPISKTTPLSKVSGKTNIPNPAAKNRNAIPIPKATPHTISKAPGISRTNTRACPNIPNTRIRTGSKTVAGNYTNTSTRAKQRAKASKVTAHKVQAENKSSRVKQEMETPPSEPQGKGWWIPRFPLRTRPQGGIECVWEEEEVYGNDEMGIPNGAEIKEEPDTINGVEIKQEVKKENATPPSELESGSSIEFGGFKLGARPAGTDASDAYIRLLHIALSSSSRSGNYSTYRIEFPPSSQKLCVQSHLHVPSGHDLITIKVTLAPEVLARTGQYHLSVTQQIGAHVESVRQHHSRNPALQKSVDPAYVLRLRLGVVNSVVVRIFVPGGIGPLAEDGKIWEEEEFRLFFYII